VIRHAYDGFVGPQHTLEGQPRLHRCA
jgi:hypothetical protein